MLSQVRVRMRVDGILQNILQSPISTLNAMIARVKILGGLNIAERRAPQDGRFNARVLDREIDVRLSVIPTVHGEKAVMRLLDRSTFLIPKAKLGFTEENMEKFNSILATPHGIVLVAGPTGSGKSTTLYTMLDEINNTRDNIVTIEDPVEYMIDGLNQTQVNAKAGMGFASGLRSILRQDPDIIMVGEIRDLETADIAIKAAQTGHLVLSTLHTNDAPTTLTRMRNMGIAPFNIASSVILITAQRLARRLCPACKKPEDIPRQALIEAGYDDNEIDGSWVPYGPVGCDACNNGYKGRVGIYQVMPVSEEIQRIILTDGNAVDIAAQAKADGVRSLRESGLVKVKQGMTSLEEVLAVTNE
jgi:type IV pilus assembly protein PilB